jgi:hypothetical protein
VLPSPAGGGSTKIFLELLEKKKTALFIGRK